MPVQNAIDWNEVVRQIQDGDPQGEERLAAFISGTIPRYIAFKHTDRKQDADDIVQETYLATLEAIQRGVEEPGAMPALIARIVQRKCWQENTNYHSKLPLEAFGDSFRDKRQNPEKQAIEQQKHAIAIEAIQTLKPREQEILQRFYLDGQPQEQITREMGLTDNQFRLMKSRSKQAVEAKVARKLQAPLRLDENTVSPQAVQSTDPHRDGEPRQDGGCDAKGLLVEETLAALTPRRIPVSAHSDAVAQLTEARRELIRAKIDERQGDMPGEDATTRAKEARKRLGVVYSRKLMHTGTSVSWQDLEAIETFLDKRLGKKEGREAHADFTARITSERGTPPQKKERF